MKIKFIIVVLAFLVALAGAYWYWQAQQINISLNFQQSKAETCRDQKAQEASAICVAISGMGVCEAQTNPPCGIDGNAEPGDPICIFFPNSNAGSAYLDQACNGGGTPPPQCSDGKDNDGDGLFDMNDPGCTDTTDDSEVDTPPQDQCVGTAHCSNSTIDCGETGLNCGGGVCGACNGGGATQCTKANEGTHCTSTQHCENGICVKDPLEAAKPIVCAPKTQTVAVGETATVKARKNGKAVSGTWKASGGTPSSGSGKTFSVSYNSAGTKRVTLKLGSQTATCKVIVTAATETTPTPYHSCIPRPACLDTTPPCLLAEPADGWCQEPTPTSTACTLEAKVCPDGSSVGRVPPSCDFAPCPDITLAPTPTISCLDTIHMCGGPSCSACNITEGSLISSYANDGNPDIFIINAYGYKRVFLNEVIFLFYGHLGGFQNVKPVTPSVRASYITSPLYRNCETNDATIYGLQITGADTGILHRINASSDELLSEDSNYQKKTFCINNNEYNWYPKGSDYTLLSQVPGYNW